MNFFTGKRFVLSSLTFSSVVLVVDRVAIASCAWKMKR